MGVRLKADLRLSRRLVSRRASGTIGIGWIVDVVARSFGIERLISISAQAVVMGYAGELIIEVGVGHWQIWQRAKLQGRSFEVKILRKLSERLRDVGRVAGGRLDGLAGLYGLDGLAGMDWLAELNGLVR